MLSSARSIIHIEGLAELYRYGCLHNYIIRIDGVIRYLNFLFFEISYG